MRLGQTIAKSGRIGPHRRPGSDVTSLVACGPAGNCMPATDILIYSVKVTWEAWLIGVERPKRKQSLQTVCAVLREIVSGFYDVSGRHAAHGDQMRATCKILGILANQHTLNFSITFAGDQVVALFEAYPGPPGGVEQFFRLPFDNSPNRRVLSQQMGPDI